MTRETIRVAARECPPRSRKLSSTPTSSDRTSDQIPATISSARVRGAKKAGCSFGLLEIDTGSACRSPCRPATGAVRQQSQKRKESYSPAIFLSGRFSTRLPQPRAFPKRNRQSRQSVFILPVALRSLLRRRSSSRLRTASRRSLYVMQIESPSNPEISPLPMTN